MSKVTLEEVIACIDAYKNPLWLCPIDPMNMTGPPKFTFGEKRVYGDREAPHLGIDLAAPAGTLLSAPFPCEVVRVANRGAWGNRVYMKRHDSEDYVAYCHCDKVWAEVGEVYERGATVATVGNSGNSTGPHVHTMASGILRFWESWDNPWVALSYLKNPRYLFDFKGALA